VQMQSHQTAIVWWLSYLGWQIHYSLGVCNLHATLVLG